MSIPPTETAYLSEVATHFGVPEHRIAVAVTAAQKLSPSEFAVLEELLRPDSLSAEQRRAMAEGFLEAFREYCSQPFSDLLSDVDEEIDAKATAKAILWSDVEIRTNRGRLLRDSVSAEEAGKLIGRSRQTVERQRRARHVLALREGGQWRYPVWQFDAEEPGGVLPGLAEVLEHLHMSPAGAALWLLTPRSELDDKTPLERLRSREARRVMRLAEQQGYLP